MRGAEPAKRLAVLGRSLYSLVDGASGGELLAKSLGPLCGLSRDQDPKRLFSNTASTFLIPGKMNPGSEAGRGISYDSVVHAQGE
jgi:hypothetical protein